MEYLVTLTKHRLESLRQAINEELHHRYPKKTGAPLYGQLSRSYTNDELAWFFQHVRHPKAYLLFKLMYGLALSNLEACRTRTAHVQLEYKRIWIASAKGRKSGWFALNDELVQLLSAWFTSGGPGPVYAFPAVKKSNKYPHLSPSWLAKEFRAARAAAGLDFSYGTSRPCGQDMRPRPLYQFGTHSFRHTLLQGVQDAFHDLYLTKEVARHKNIRSTEVYAKIRQSEKDHALLHVSMQGKILS